MVGVALFAGLIVVALPFVFANVLRRRAPLSTGSGSAPGSRFQALARVFQVVIRGSNPISNLAPTHSRELTGAEAEMDEAGETGGIGEDRLEACPTGKFPSTSASSISTSAIGISSTSS
jgi:hypothetical protein